MGIFSSKKKTTVGTSVSRVISDNNLPDSRKAGLINSVISGSELVPSMMDEVVQGIGIKGNRYFRWAKKNYYYSVYTGRYATEKDGDEEIIKILGPTAEYGIKIEYSHLAPANLQHAAWEQLVNKYGYELASNTIPKLSQEKNVPVYLEDIIIVLPEGTINTRNPEELVKWGISPTAGKTPTRAYSAERSFTDYAEKAGITTEEAHIYYTWVVNGIVYRDFLIIVLPEFSDDAEYFHVRYRVLDKPQTPIIQNSFITSVNINPIIGYRGAVPNPADDPVKYWTYKRGEGTYPLLDTSIDSPGTSGEFFPSVYYRYNKAPIPNNGAYQSSVKLNDFFGFDYDEIRRAINRNPGIKDVEQAMMSMAVPARTSNETEIRYLFDFFKRMISADNKFANVDFAWRTGTNAIVVQDRLFKKAISNDAMERNLILSKGPVGRYRMGIARYEISSRTYSQGYSFGSAGLSYGQERRITVTTTTIYDPPQFGGGVRSSSITTQTVQNTSYGLLSFIGNGFIDPNTYIHIYRKQITPDIEEEIRVWKMKSTYYIYKDYVAIGDWNDGSLLVPLDYSITRAYPLFTREELYARSLHYIFNSRVTVKVKWYQSSFFKALIRVASLVLLVYSAGSTSYISGVLAATGAFTATQILILSFIINGIIGLVVQKLLKVFVKAVGLEFALLISAFVAIKFGPSLLAKYGMPGTTTAEQLLYVANGLINAKTSLISEDIAGLSKEFEAFNLLKTEKEKELERANKLLETSVRLDPFIIFGESSDDYYNRMAHSGNIGVLSLDAANKYVDIALTLPTIDETIQL